MIFVTGGAGFIGANFVLDWLAHCDEPVLNLDLLTYAGNLENLARLAGDARHVFVQGDICDAALLARLFARHQPRAVAHFAAESHVDRSILGPGEFVRANIEGTFCLLEAARAYWARLPAAEARAFRFHHVSTDEVYGSLRPEAPPFTEQSPHAPNSPYSASKAASDHLARAWHRTYGLPVTISHCSNNYGPFQFPEKLIPFMILAALADRPLPLYGDGAQARDWLHVSDHCAAIRRILVAGQAGETYDIGGASERTNQEVVRHICALLDRLRPRADGRSHAERIVHVTDRPGHDRRYAIEAGKITRELGWQPAETFASGLEKTVRWYLDHPEWIANAQSGAYREWIARQYGTTA
ncbi:MAG: dTDP-glucose 4,6-dehydratase [Zoogloeaceae bacterium]|nr:dTDP-glucose 4,6-dehydratase [Zoogloeaceae bacterium]